MPMMRRAGILLHPSSLPHFGPCGDLGDSAIRFLDWLKLSSIGLCKPSPCTLWAVGFHRTVPHLHLQVPHISSHWTGWLNRAF